MKGGTTGSRVVLCLAFASVLAFRPILGTEVGILGGPSVSRFYSLDLSWDYRLSYSAGVYADFRLHRLFRLQPGLRFLSIRSSAAIPFDAPVGDVGWTSHDLEICKTVQYIELPLILRFFPFNGNKIRPNLQLGGDAALRLHGEDHLEFMGQSHTEDIHDELKAFQAGILVGMGVDFRIGGSPVHLSGLWRAGLSPAAADHLDRKTKSSGFLITLGVGLWHHGGLPQ